MVNYLRNRSIINRNIMLKLTSKSISSSVAGAVCSERDESCTDALELLPAPPRCK